MRESKLTGYECIALMVYCVFSAFLCMVPGDMLAGAGHAAWISAVLAGALALALGLVLERAARGRGIIEIGSAGWGRAPLFLLGLVFLLVSARSMRALTEQTMVYALPSVNRIGLCFLFSCAVLYCCMSGIESLGRAMRVALPLSLLLYVLMLAAAPVEQSANVSALFPLLGNGLPSIAQGAGQSGVCFLALLFPLMELSRFQGNRKKTIVRGVLLAGALVAVGYIACALTLPDEPFYIVFSSILDMAAVVGMGEYLRRFTALFSLVWIVGLLASCTAFAYYAARCISRSFGIEEHKFVALPVVSAMFTLATPSRFISPDWVNSLLDAVAWWGYLLFLPAVLLLLLGLWRSRGEKGEKHAKA